MIIERVTGKTFQEEIDRVINTPTGMDLKLIAEATSLPDMSPYWERKGSDFIAYPHWTWIKGDGGLTATSIMLAQFPKSWASGELIGNDLFDEMIKPRILNDGIVTGYGLGVRNGNFFGERIIGHTGGHKSTYSIMVFFPERDLTIVCFVNTDNTTSSARKVFGEFATTYLGLESSIKAIDNVQIDDVSKYLGEYGAYDEKIASRITIEQDESNQLVYCMNDQCYPMIYLGDQKFWIEEWPYDFVTFQINDEGEVMAIKEYYTGFYSILRKKLDN